MGKGFRLQISKLISSLQSCRSKHPSSLPKNPVPLSHAHKPSIRATPSKPHLSPASAAYTPEDLRIRRQEFRWRKEEKWHVVAMTTHDKKATPRRKISNSSLYEETLAMPPSTAEKRNRRARKSNKVKATGQRTSTSSSGYENRIDEASRTFSTDSSSNSATSQPNSRRTRTRRKPKKNNIRSPKCGVFRSSPSSDSELPARLSVFKKLIPCSVDGKVKESFAVVKRSKDPYEDFKGSMMEMILEKQMFEKRDLEQLLQCFLSLNTRQYHGVIVEVFSEIWEALFCTNNNNSDYSSEGSTMSSGSRRKGAVC